MKRAWIIFAAGLLVAVAGYFGCYVLGSASGRNLAQSPAPELAWLRQEFHLDDAEFQRISQLHEAYQSQCGEMCRRIAAKNAELNALLSTNQTVTPQIKANLAEAAQIRADCQAAMLAHFCEVSRAMPPEEGKRYLTWVVGKTLDPMAAMPDMSAHESGQQ